MGNWQENGAEVLLCQGAILLNTGLNLWKKLMNTIFYIYSQIKHTTIMIWTNHPCISPWRQPSNWAYSYLSTFSILVVCSLLDCVHVQSDSTGRHVNSFSLHLSTLGLSLSQDNNKQIPITILSLWSQARMVTPGACKGSLQPVHFLWWYPPIWRAASSKNVKQ